MIAVIDQDVCDGGGVVEGGGRGGGGGGGGVVEGGGGGGGGVVEGGGGGRGLKGVEFNPSHNLGWSTINMYNLKVTDIGNYALK